MEHTISKLDCWILDEVETDFIMVLELISVLHQRQSNLYDSEILAQLKERLTYLSECGYLSFYKGFYFNGDELKTEIVITDVFIQDQTWNGINQNTSDELVKIYITELGRNVFLKNCSADAFL